MTMCFIYTQNYYLLSERVMALWVWANHPTCDREVENALVNDNVIGNVLMDLSKAFECIPHSLLIAKMNTYGIFIYCLYDYPKSKSRLRLSVQLCQRVSGLFGFLDGCFASCPLIPDWLQLGCCPQHPSQPFPFATLQKNGSAEHPSILLQHVTHFERREEWKSITWPPLSCFIPTISKMALPVHYNVHWTVCQYMNRQ